MRYGDQSYWLGSGSILTLIFIIYGCCKYHLTVLSGSITDRGHSSATRTRSNSRFTQQCLCHTVKLRVFTYLPSDDGRADPSHSIVEANHALDHLGAVGIGCLSNHEGQYLGNKQITPFLVALDARNSSKEIIYVHSTEPVLNLNGTLISVNPSRSLFQ